MRIGAMELRLLEHIGTRGPASIREAAETFGGEHGVGLTTVQKMMDRLRAKGLLEREKVDGLWVYRAAKPREGVLKSVVKDFVERTLGGSLEPLALYLADRKDLSDEELGQLRRIVERLSDAEERPR